MSLIYWVVPFALDVFFTGPPICLWRSDFLEHDTVLVELELSTLVLLQVHILDTSVFRDCTNKVEPLFWKLSP